MSVNGKKTITEIVGVMKHNSDPNSSPFGNNDDKGIAIKFNGKVADVEEEEVIANVYQTRERKESVFSILRKLASVNEDIGNEIEGSIYNVDISNSLYKKKKYTRDEVRNYYNKMNNITNGNGAIYSLDIETMGENPSLKSMNKNSKGSAVNRRHFAMTEVSIWKSYKNEKGEWVRENISNFTSAPENINIAALLADENADQTTNITLQRIAGYSAEDAIGPNGEVLQWKPGMDTSDLNVLGDGKANLEKIPTKRVSKSSKNKAGYENYKKEFKEKVLDPLLKISKEDNSILTTINGLGFDLPQILAEAQYLGLTEGYESLFKNHYDIQVMQSQFIQDLKYDKIRKYNEKYKDDETKPRLKESLKLEEQGRVLRDEIEGLTDEIERLFGTTEVPHMASYDTFMTTIESQKTFEEASDRIKDYLDKSASKMDITDDSLFVATESFVAKDSSLHFFVKQGELNSYNSVILNRDTPYKMKTYSIKSKEEIASIIGNNTLLANDRNREVLEGIENKVMVELTDHFDESNKAYMFYNSMEEVQEDLIDSQLLQHMSSKDYDKLRRLKKSLGENRLDKTRRDLDGFGSTNSWKKVDRLQMFVDQYQDLKHYQIEGLGRGLTDKELNMLLRGEEFIATGPDDFRIKVSPSSVFSNLTVKKEYGNEIVETVPIERLELFKELFDDLDINADFYEQVLSHINENYKSKHTITYDNNSTYKTISQNLKVDDITSTFGGVMREIEDVVLANKTELDKARYIINSNKRTKRRYEAALENEKVKAFKGKTIKPNSDLAKEYNSFKVSEEKEMEIIKRIFKQKYHQDFDLEGSVARNLLRDRKELHGIKIATSIDILGHNDGSYRNVSFKSKDAFKSKLSQSVYTLDSKNNNSRQKTKNQMTYLDNIIYDLEKRKILSPDSVAKLKESTELTPKISLLADELFNAKDKFEGIIKSSLKVDGKPRRGDSVLEAVSRGTGYVRKIVKSDEDFDFVLPFLENRVMVDKFSGKTNTIMGVPISKHVENLEIAGQISKNEIINKVMSNNASNFSFVGHLKDAKPDVLKDMFGEMYSELGWSEQNIKTFEKAITSKDFNRRLNITGRDNPTVFDKILVKQDGQYNLVMTDSRNYVRDRLASGATLDEIKDRAIVYRLPKVEELHGIKYISQSDAYKKLVSDDIVPSVKKGNTFVEYYMRDTVDEVLEGFGRDLGHSLRFIEDNKDYERANRRIKAGWSGVNEAKSLNGVSHVYNVSDAGELVIDTVFSPNRGDLARSKVVNYTPLVYEIQTVLDLNPELKEKLANEIGKEELNNFTQVAARIKQGIVDGKKPFEEMTDIMANSREINTFMADNMKEIATTLLNDDNFISRASGSEYKRGIIDYLKTIAEFGDFSVLGKESDVYKGYGSTIGIHNLVPFSDMSGTARNVQFQSLNGYSILENSLMSISKFVPIGKNDTIDDVYESLGIKPNLTVNTSMGMNFAKQKYGHDQSIVGFSTKMKATTPEKFNNRLRQVYDTGEIGEVWMKKLVDSGVSDVTKEEIKKVAKLISQSTGLYEDDGMINIALAEVLNPRTVGSEKVYNPSNSLKIGQKIKAGTILGTDINGKPIVYNKDNAVIKNIKDGSVVLQLNEHYNNIKLNMGGSEKAIFSAPNFKRTGDKSIDDRMLKIISMVQYHISDGANIVANPDVRKHVATNTAFIPKISAITNAITNEEEADFVRGAFKDMAKSLDVSIEYNEKRKGYVFIQNPSLNPYSDGSNPFEEIESVIDYIKKNSSKNNGFNSRVANNLAEVQEKGLGWMDVFLASNNTIERGMGADGVGSGVSLSSRAMAVNGTTRMVNEELMAEYTGTIFPNLLKREAELILEGNQEKAIQANNIFAAYALNAGEESVRDNLSIKTIKLDDIVVPTGNVEADMLDDIFKFQLKDGSRYNVYEIDLSGLDVGFKLDNQFYIEEALSKKQAKILNTQARKIDKIYVPAIVPNYHDGHAMLNKTQKSMAELVWALQKVGSKEQNGNNIAYSHELANIKMKNFLEQSAFDIMNKDGLRIKSQKTKDNPMSFRVESQKVIAPIKNDKGQLDDLAFGDLVTPIDKDGNVKFIKSVFVNEETLIRNGLDLDIVGYDVLKLQVANKEEQINFLKRFMNERGISTEVMSDDLKSLQRRVLKMIDDNQTTASELASSFLEIVGIEGGVVRDPSIRIESFNGVRLRTAEGIQVGASVTDYGTADGMKLDNDGDKIGVMLKSFFGDENGNLRLRHHGDQVRTELRVDSEGTSDFNLRKLDEMSNDLKVKMQQNENIFDTIRYVEEAIVDSIGKTDDMNFLTNEVARKVANLANISKRYVGETSNPGLYLRRAAAEYREELARKDVALAKSFSKSIDIGALITEQKSIDYKLANYTMESVAQMTEQIKRAMKMEETWGNLFIATRKDLVSPTNNTKRDLTKSIVSALEMLRPYASTKASTKESTSLGIMFESKNFSSIEDLNEIARKIINHEVSRHKSDSMVYVEEFIYDLLNTFRHDKSASIYKNMLTRQSEGALGSIFDGKKNVKYSNKMLGLVESMNDARNAGNIYLSHTNEVATEQFSDTFLMQDVILDNTYLKSGNLVHLKEFGDVADVGVYKVRTNDYNGREVSLSLIDVNSGKSYNFAGRHTFEVRDKLIAHGAKVLPDETHVAGAFNESVATATKKVSNDIFENKGTYSRIKNEILEYADALDNGKLPTALQTASVQVLGQYDIDKLDDIHNTLDGLRIMGYELDDNKTILEQMNESLLKKGTADYQATKKQVLMKQNALIASGVSSGSAYDKLIGSAISASDDFTKVKTFLEASPRISTEALTGSPQLSAYFDKVADVISGSIDLPIDSVANVRDAGYNKAKKLFSKRDKHIYTSLNRAFVKNQDNELFRKEVLGWDLEMAKEFITNDDVESAINVLNNAVIIHSEEYTGVKLGRLSLDELTKVKNLSSETGIKSEIVRMNNQIIEELISLRKNHDIMLNEDIAEPIIENYSEAIGSEMRNAMEEEIRKKGSKIKRTSSNGSSDGLLSSVFDGIKGRVSGMTSKQKMFAGAVAAATLGTTALIGVQANKGRAELRRSNENDQLIEARSSVNTAPASDKVVYTSDHNAINVNVKGRSPMGAVADGAERAISSLFGNNVSVNSNIQDSRREITDREVDEAMSRAIR